MYYEKIKKRYYKTFPVNKMTVKPEPLKDIDIRELLRLIPYNKYIFYLTYDNKLKIGRSFIDLSKPLKEQKVEVLKEIYNLIK